MPHPPGCKARFICEYKFLWMYILVSCNCWSETESRNICELNVCELLRKIKKAEVNNCKKLINELMGFVPLPVLKMVVSHRSPAVYVSPL